MNKQEALEALLVKLRGWEEPTEEVRKEDPSVVAEAMYRNMTLLLDMREAEIAGAPVGDAEWREVLSVIGAGALYLLIDEVEVVAGRSLDTWLADLGDKGSVVVPSSAAYVIGNEMLVQRPDDVEEAVG